MFTTKEFIVPYLGNTPNPIIHTIFYGETGIGSTCSGIIKDYLKGEKFNCNYNNKYVKSDLYLSCKNQIHFYSIEFPIIKYEVESSKNINAFIKNINVSIVFNGAITYANENSIVKTFYTRPVEYDVITYITSPDGTNYIIDDAECNITISRNPNLFLTNDGIIIAFFKHNAIATFDMKHSIDLGTMIPSPHTINSVERNEHGALYLVSSESGKIEKYYLSFDINFSSPNIIECPNLISNSQMKEMAQQHLEDLKKLPKIDFSSIRKRSNN